MDRGGTSASYSSKAAPLATPRGDSRLLEPTFPELTWRTPFGLSVFPERAEAFDRKTELLLRSSMNRRDLAGMNGC